ncbi:STAS domain-containing protein [Streptomyces antimicrobicus]|uniref:Anti-sigma factor antagonist n=1 Tax=Streptomyces antimicrobicus TaxID=2883108 RepID=A0ABS8B343_9ACTN|nr:STAS domain-containing protein [Streptomyces antimicrobicus]MCB5179025.1 STAS domain-containing protein [Streptomyces antimicrobicus]
MTDDLGNDHEDIDVETVGVSTVVRPYGEMDVTRSQDFREVLLAALSADGPGREVVVDLQHLSFCDSAGLNALLDARARAEATGQRLSLAAPRGQFTRLLEITGTAHLFPITPPPGTPS